MSSLDLNLLNELIQKELDGVLLDDEFIMLQSILNENDAAVEYYSNSVILFSMFQGSDSAEIFSKSVIDGSVDNLDNSDVLHALADDEQSAESIEMDIECSAVKPVKKNKTIVGFKKLEKVSQLYSYVIKIAAVFLIMFILYANMFPPQPTVPVATVSDQIDVIWEQGSAVLNTNEIVLTNQQPYSITDGVLKIRYNSGVDVIVEAPAKFQIIDGDELKLDHGRVFAVVPPAGIGFAVQTENSRIIDLGTEFGVQVNANGDTSLHVIKGKTRLVAGNRADSVSIEVNEGIAKRISAINNNVQEIYCKAEFFVRDINSGNNLIWRGQNRICLADIIGGGNGFGTGQDSIAIDPASGEISNEIITATRSQNNNEFYPVDDNPYIDGVFVPFGIGNPLETSSLGHIFEQCPKTTGQYWMGISNKPVINPEVTVEQPHDFEFVKLDGIQYGTKSHPAIIMHANCGITFDLDEIRKTIPEREIVSFTAIGGLSETVRGKNFMKEASAVLWVLVDGTVVQKIDVDINNDNNDIAVLLDDNARFITLISTDGQNNINCDWAFFGSPSLMLK